MACIKQNALINILIKAQHNEAKRLTEHAKDKAKQCLAEAHRLSGVTNPNDITSEKQAVCITHSSAVHCNLKSFVNSNTIVTLMI